MSDSDFSIKRIWRLMAMDWIAREKEFLIVGLSVLLVIFFLQLGSWWLWKVGFTPFVREYVILFIVTGIMFTTGSFRDLRSHQAAYSLCLPATTLEKYLARYIWTGPLYVVAFNLVYCLALVSSHAFVRLILNKDIPLMPVFHVMVFKYLAMYFFLHAVYFCGTLASRGQNVLITTAVLAVLAAVNFVIVPFALLGTSGAPFALYYLTSNSNYVPVRIVRTTIDLVYLEVFVLGMPLLWVSAYLLLKEKEA